MNEKKFSLEEIISDSPKVITHDLEKQLNKKRRKRGGSNEANAIKRAELQAFELILKRLNSIEAKLTELIMNEWVQY